MDVRHLRSFIAVVDLGSVPEAAQSLGIPYLAIVLHLKIIGASLGASVVLFDDGAATTTLAGDLLLDTARSLIRQADDATVGIRRMIASQAESSPFEVTSHA